MYNNNRDSIYVECSYLSSKDQYFPNNKPNNFFVRLNKPLKLSGGVSWKVGLCEIDIVINNNIKLQTEPHSCQVKFSACDGIFIKGKQTHCLRTIPYSSNGKHKMFHTVYYMPVNTGYIETFEINVRPISSDEKHMTTFDQSLFGLITCTLHFKRVK